MADLYLSQRETYLLGYATLIWAYIQWWDIVNRYVVKKYTRNHATILSGQPDLSENGEQQGTTNRKQVAQMNDLEGKPSESERVSRLDHVFRCLSSKNDTQRFVGLTLLMRYLEGMQGDYGLISKCWAAIPDTFITRLLRTRFREDTICCEINAQDQTKFDLGLAALHFFASILPQEYLQVMLPTDMSAKVREGWRLRIEALMVEVPYRYSGLCSSPHYPLRID